MSKRHEIGHGMHFDFKRLIENKLFKNTYYELS